jgi:hypothetical protein
MPCPLPPPPRESGAKQALDAQDYQRKNEGGYFTGLPLANYDSNTGVGFGVRGYYYYNGHRSDPLFGYTPYFFRTFLQLFATTGGLQFHWLDVDAPTIAGSPFRFRSQQVMREAVREGLALGLLSPWLVHTDLERGTLVRVLPEAEGEEFSVYAVYLPSRTQPARIREFLQHCVREVPRIPGLVRP